MQIPSLNQDSYIQAFSQSSDLQLHTFHLPVLPYKEDLHRSVHHPGSIPARILPVSDPASEARYLRSREDRRFLFL